MIVGNALHTISIVEPGGDVDDDDDGGGDDGGGDDEAGGYDDGGNPRKDEKEEKASVDTASDTARWGNGGENINNEKYAEMSSLAQTAEGESWRGKSKSGGEGGRRGEKGEKSDEEKASTTTAIVTAIKTTSLSSVKTKKQTTTAVEFNVKTDVSFKTPLFPKNAAAATTPATENAATEIAALTNAAAVKEGDVRDKRESRKTGLGKASRSPRSSGLSRSSGSTAGLPPPHYGTKTGHFET